MRQKGLTVITEILPGKKKELQELLEAIGSDIENNGTIAFDKFQTVHFMRWVILDAATVKGRNIKDKLVLSTNFDGPLDSHLEDLCMHAGNGLFRIYDHCKGSPETQDPASMISYLKNHRTPIAAFYRGTSGRGVIQIRNEQKLWYRIQEYLNKHLDAEAPGKIKDSLVKHLKNDASLNWAFEKYTHELTHAYGTFLLILLVLIILGAFVWLARLFPQILWGVVPLLLLVVTWWIVLRRKEKKDSEEFNAIRQDSSRIAQLTRKEDYKTQNQLTHLVEVKPGLTRAITLRMVLWLINLLATYMFNRGSLAGIQSIHYARWVLLDGRLLFFSNYDGSWESYLGEFVDRASIGLTAVWSNTKGFPPTRNLIKGGARHSAEFKAWARKQQIPTQVWYSAYPASSIKNINNNTAIRQGLLRNEGDKGTREFLQRL